MSTNHFGAQVSKIPIAVANAIAVAVVALMLGTPAHATSLAVTDYCANIKSGQIHPVISDKCAPGDRSLGLGKLLPQPKRPQQLNPQLVARFNAARTVGKSHGHTIEIRSGWRSVNHQQHLFNAAVQKYGSVTAASKWVLPPTKSLHTWGLAIDVRYVGNAASASRWFQKYSSHFGLCRRYKNEWWHYEPLVSPGQPCPPLESSAKSSLSK
jgi:hypothetical protein